MRVICIYIYKGYGYVVFFPCAVLSTMASGCLPEAAGDGDPLQPRRWVFSACAAPRVTTMAFPASLRSTPPCLVTLLIPPVPKYQLTGPCFAICLSPRGGGSPVLAGRGGSSLAKGSSCHTDFSGRAKGSPWSAADSRGGRHVSPRRSPVSVESHPSRGWCLQGSPWDSAGLRESWVLCH